MCIRDSQQVLAVLRLDEHAVLVIRVEGDLPVILFLLQDIVQSVVEQREPAGVHP